MTFSVGYRLLAILLVSADIVVGWYASSEMYKEVNEHMTCPSHDGYLFSYCCQVISTILNVIQILVLLTEICMCEKLDALCHFSIVFVSYLAVMAGSVSNIGYLSHCRCTGRYSGNWTAGNVVLIHGLTSGVSRLAIQLLIHASEILDDWCMNRKEKTPGAIKVVNCMIFSFYLILLIIEYISANCSV